MTFVSGKLGFVQVSGNAPGVTYAFDKWGVNFKSHLPITTNFMSLGFQALLSGVQSATVTLEGPYDLGGMPFSTLNGVTVYLGIVTGFFFSVPVAVENINVQNDVNGNPRVSITGQSTGSFAPSLL